MQEMPEKRFFGLHRNVFFTGLVSLFMDISSEMVYPLVPLFLTGVLGTTKTTVGIIEGIAESTASILKVLSGWLSDILGKRKLLMAVGYGTSAASRPILYSAAGWGGVLSARFVDRFGKGIRTSPRDAIIAESTENEILGKAFGFHRAMDTVGGIIGPALAAVLLSILSGDIRLIFLISTIPGVMAVLLVLVFVKEKTRAKAKKISPFLNFTSIRGNAMGRYLIVIFVFSLGNTSDAFLILRAQNLGIPVEIIPLAYMVLNAVYAATSVPLGIIADRVGLKNMVLLGFIFYSAVYAGFAFAANATHIWILFFSYGLFKGISDGSQRAYLAQIANTTRMGTAFGIFHTAVGLTLLPASVIGGILWDKMGPAGTFLYGSALSLLAVVIFILPSRNTA